MKTPVRALVLAALVLLMPLPHAHAQIFNGQEGDNKSRTDQSGTSGSGDANAGQIVGAASAGTTSVDATNATDRADVSTGDARASNESNDFTGQNVSDLTFIDNLPDIGTTDVTAGFSVNLQEGDNRSEVVQLATVLSGNGVAGEVIGVVTSAGGSSGVVAANTSKDVDVSTGDATSRNVAASFAGQSVSFFTGIGAFLTDVFTPAGAINVHEGDNTVRDAQTALAATGDGVAGQVLGVVSAGDTTVDATNRSEWVDVASGDASAVNTTASFTGQNVAFAIETLAEDVFTALFAINVQEGNNRTSLAQHADSSSGDVVGGQIAGIVTSAGGSADVVLANTSTMIDDSSGDAREFNSNESIVGQSVTLFLDV